MISIRFHDPPASRYPTSLPDTESERGRPAGSRGSFHAVDASVSRPTTVRACTHIKTIREPFMKRGFPARTACVRRRRLWLAATALVPSGAAAQIIPIDSDGAARIAAVPDPTSAEVPVAEPAGDIVVTARRRTERAQDVPIALSVVGAEQFGMRGDYRLDQVQQLVPSLQVFSFNPRNTNINIRGSAPTSR